MKPRILSLSSYLFPKVITTTITLTIVIIIMTFYQQFTNAFTTTFHKSCNEATGTLEYGDRDLGIPSSGDPNAVTFTYKINFRKTNETFCKKIIIKNIKIVGFLHFEHEILNVDSILIEDVECFGRDVESCLHFSKKIDGVKEIFEIKNVRKNITYPRDYSSSLANPLVAAKSKSFGLIFSSRVHNVAAVFRVVNCSYDVTLETGTFNLNKQDLSSVYFFFLIIQGDFSFPLILVDKYAGISICNCTSVLFQENNFNFFAKNFDFESLSTTNSNNNNNNNNSMNIPLIIDFIKLTGGISGRFDMDDKFLLPDGTSFYNTKHYDHCVFDGNTFSTVFYSHQNIHCCMFRFRAGVAKKLFALSWNENSHQVALASSGRKSVIKINTILHVGIQDILTLSILDTNMKIASVSAIYGSVFVSIFSAEVITTWKAIMEVKRVVSFVVSNCSIETTKLQIVAATEYSSSSTNNKLVDLFGEIIAEKDLSIVLFVGGMNDDRYYARTTVSDIQQFSFLNVTINLNRIESRKGSLVISLILFPEAMTKVFFITSFPALFDVGVLNIKNCYVVIDLNDITHTPSSTFSSFTSSTTKNVQQQQQLLSTPRHQNISAVDFIRIHVFLGFGSWISDIDSINIINCHINVFGNGSVNIMNGTYIRANEAPTTTSAPTTTTKSPFPIATPAPAPPSSSNILPVISVSIIEFEKSKKNPSKDYAMDFIANFLIANSTASYIPEFSSSSSSSSWKNNNNNGDDDDDSYQYKYIPPILQVKIAVNDRIWKHSGSVLMKNCSIKFYGATTRKQSLAVVGLEEKQKQKQIQLRTLSIKLLSWNRVSSNCSSLSLEDSEIFVVKDSIRVNLYFYICAAKFRKEDEKDGEFSLARAGTNLTVTRTRIVLEKYPFVALTMTRFTCKIVLVRFSTMAHNYYFESNAILVDAATTTTTTTANEEESLPSVESLVRTYFYDDAGGGYLFKNKLEKLFLVTLSLYYQDYMLGNTDDENPITIYLNYNIFSFFSSSSSSSSSSEKNSCPSCCNPSSCSFFHDVSGEVDIELMMDKNRISKNTNISLVYGLVDTVDFPITVKNMIIEKNSNNNNNDNNVVRILQPENEDYVEKSDLSHVELYCTCNHFSNWTRTDFFVSEFASDFDNARMFPDYYYFEYPCATSTTTQTKTATPSKSRETFIDTFSISEGTNSNTESEETITKHFTSATTSKSRSHRTKTKTHQETSSHELTATVPKTLTNKTTFSRSESKSDDFLSKTKSISSSHPLPPSTQILNSLAIKSASGVMLLAGTIASSPGAYVMSQKLLSVAGLALCPRSSTDAYRDYVDDLGFEANPTTMKISSRKSKEFGVDDPFSTYRGSLIGNTVLTVGIILVVYCCCVIAASMLEDINNNEEKENLEVEDEKPSFMEKFVYQRLRWRLPGRLYNIAFLAGVGTSSAVGTVAAIKSTDVISSNTAVDYMLVAIPCLLLICLPLFYFIKIALKFDDAEHLVDIITKKEDENSENKDDDRNKKKKKNKSNRSSRTQGQLESENENISQMNDNKSCFPYLLDPWSAWFESDFVRANGTLFENVSFPKFISIDFICAVVIGISGGAGSLCETTKCCTAAISCSLISAVAHFFALAFVRPQIYCCRFDVVVQFVASLLNLLQAILVIVIILQEGTDLLAAVELLAYAGIFLGLFDIAVSIGVAVYDISRGYRRSVKFAAESYAASKEKEEGNENENEEDNKNDDQFPSSSSSGNKKSNKKVVRVVKKNQPHQHQERSKSENSISSSSQRNNNKNTGGGRRRRTAIEIDPAVEENNFEMPLLLDDRNKTNNIDEEKPVVVCNLRNLSQLENLDKIQKRKEKEKKQQSNNTNNKNIVTTTAAATTTTNLNSIFLSQAPVANKFNDDNVLTRTEINNNNNQILSNAAAAAVTSSAPITSQPIRPTTSQQTGNNNNDDYYYFPSPFEFRTPHQEEDRDSEDEYYQNNSDNNNNNTYEDDGEEIEEEDFDEEELSRLLGTTSE